MIIDQGNRASAGSRGARGDDHRPSEASAGPRVDHRPGQPSAVPAVCGADRQPCPRACRSSPGLVTSIDQGKRQPCGLSSVPVVPIVAGLTSIDRGKRQPSPARPVVSALSIVAGLLTSIDQGKRQPCRVPVVPVVPIVAGPGERSTRGSVSRRRGARGDEHRPGEASAGPRGARGVDRRRGLVSIDRATIPRPCPWCRSSACPW